MLENQVERQMRASIKMIGDFWYSAWVDAGQPDLTALTNYELGESQQKELAKEKENWLQKLFNARPEN